MGVGHSKDQPCPKTVETGCFAPRPPLRVLRGASDTVRAPCGRWARAVRIVGRIVVLLPHVDAGTIERTFSAHASEKDQWPAPAATFLGHQNIGRPAARRARAVRMFPHSDDFPPRGDHSGVQGVTRRDCRTPHGLSSPHPTPCAEPGMWATCLLVQATGLFHTARTAPRCAWAATVQIAQRQDRGIQER